MKKTVTTITCDMCDEEITDVYIDAGVYGKEFHPSCFQRMTPFEMVRQLGLDDITVRNCVNDSAICKLMSATAQHYLNI